VAEILSFNGPICFGTFNSMTSVDRNGSYFQNLMFQKLKICNFQNNSHVYCKIPLSETFRLREQSQSFWILVTLCCWVSGFFQTSRARSPVMQCHILERLGHQLHGLKTSETYTTINFLIIKNAVRKLIKM